jgi:hypothetical protein
MMLEDFNTHADRIEATFPKGTEVGDFTGKFLHLHAKYVQRLRNETIAALANVDGVGGVYEIAEILDLSSSWNSNPSLDNHESPRGTSGPQEEKPFGSPSGNLDNLTREVLPPVPTFLSQGPTVLTNPFSTALKLTTVYLDRP